MHALDVLGEPVRRRILELLAEGERSAGSVVEVIGEEFGISQPAVSHHLRLLREHGFATVRHDGARRLYAIDATPMAEVDAWLARCRGGPVPRSDTKPRGAGRSKPPRRKPAPGGGGRQRRSGGERAPRKAGRRKRPPTKRAPAEAAKRSRAKRTAREAEGARSRTAGSAGTDREALTRAIRRASLRAGEGHAAVLDMVVPAPIDDVWSACTNPSRLDRWLLPVRGDLRVGGAFALDGNAHGEILVCEPPARLRVTWRYPEMPTDEVELRLELLEGGETRLELEHASIRPPTFVLNDPGTGRWGVGAGWEVPLRVGLLPHLRGALPNRPAVEWFAFTPEVVAIADEAGLRWATAVGEA